MPNAAKCCQMHASQMYLNQSFDLKNAPEDESFILLTVFAIVSICTRREGIACLGLIKINYWQFSRETIT